MLTFLRKIRKSLIESGSTRKYLLYAIGEIVLVVIGILIALQVNNWNEHRKSSVQESIILTELIADLVYNLNDMKGILGGVNRRKEAVDSLLKFLRTDKILDDDLRLRIDLLKRGRLFNNANATYKYIEGAGFSHLSSDTLRMELTQLYEGGFSNILKQQEMEYRFKDEELHVYMRKKFAPYLFPGKLIETPLINPTNVNTLKSDVEFLNLILQYRTQLNIRSNTLEKVIQNLNEFKSMVEDEI